MYISRCGRSSPSKSPLAAQTGIRTATRHPTASTPTNQNVCRLWNRCESHREEETGILDWIKWVTADLATGVQQLRPEVQYDYRYSCTTTMGVLQLWVQAGLQAHGVRVLLRNHTYAHMKALLQFIPSVGYHKFCSEYHCMQLHPNKVEHPAVHFIMHYCVHVLCVYVYT